MRTLTTERLILRPFRPDDLAEIHRLVYGDPEVARYYSGPPATVDEIGPSFERKVSQRPGDFGFLAVERRADGRLLGLVGLQRFAPEEDTSYMVFAGGARRVGQDLETIEVELSYALGRVF